MNAPSYFFCGIGGSGMSALAAILREQGCAVAGSDRSRDKGDTPEKFAALEAAGMKLFPQDGSGVTPGTNVLVVSSAIEESIPDVQAARKLSIPVRKRAEILAELLARKKGIAIGGTSGKTTVTGMAGHILAVCGLDPSVVNGGVMVNFENNYRAGQGGWIVAEMDESDGSIALFTPDVAVLNNVTLDHKPVAELRGMFRDFLGKARTGTVVNLDDAEAAALTMPDSVGFGIERAEGVLNASGVLFSAGGTTFTVTDRRDGRQASCILNVPGRHNVLNALAAIGAATMAGVSLTDAADALASFRGIRRRLEVTGTANGITVIDDFAHNPDKIAASLATLRQTPGRLLVMFQPHGFGPMRMMRKEMAAAFASGMGPDDILYMPEIFYAGGTAVRDISSADLTGDIAAQGRRAVFVPTRTDAGDALVAEARTGDRIVVMGARDDTLTAFAKDILARAGRG